MLLKCVYSKFHCFTNLDASSKLIIPTNLMRQETNGLNSFCTGRFIITMVDAFICVTLQLNLNISWDWLDTGILVCNQPYIYPNRRYMTKQIGHYRLDIYKELTSGVNIHIALATSIIQRVFENYKGKMSFLVNSNLRVQNKLLGNIGDGGR